jgi:hypothetical protein
MILEIIRRPGGCVNPIIVRTRHRTIVLVAPVLSLCLVFDVHVEPQVKRAPLEIRALL